ncbi:MULTISPECIES: SGNH/GDSL hydrolase family protein [unclassified Solwaraspora]|uniref:SGNH/GDSL hydrolase family protein n=1 Tax=unclassified Solwaraspora TaxID=2627926 RepID=UPI00259BAC67|nr:SGNH/GDSL hydrolase family protein [Solwaraspora sp. WMMA2056]WJK38130.1 SGNH/GDSL hydrolase family protein [Solwaraspora sp. WMMA2056]
MTLRPLARAALALAVTLGAVGAGTLAAGVPAHAAPAVHYAALGDSFSSGVGAAPYETTCLRSNRSYAPLWAAANSPASFRFVACGGAVTADVLDNQLSVLDANTTMVTITIGGNDAGFADVVLNCRLGSESSCASAVNRARQFATSQLPGRLDATYAAIRQRAPNAELIVLGYPRLFEEVRNCGLFAVSLTKRTIINDAADLLAEVTADRAAAAGATFVDTRSQFAGHGVCGATPWINDFSALIAAYHPNAAGYRDGYLAALNSVTG